MFKLMMTAFMMTFSAYAAAAPVNINTADAQTLDEALNGVGPVTARRIVEFRDANGAFSDPSEIVLVKGIGEKTLEKNIEDILVD